MLAANLNARDASQRVPNQAANERSVQQIEIEPRPEPDRRKNKIDGGVEIRDAVVQRQEEEEEDVDADAEFDDDEIESELEDADETLPARVAPLLASRKTLVTPPPNTTRTSPTPRTPKRTIDDVVDEPEAEMDRAAEIVRDGTPPKRARLASTEPSAKETLSPSPMRHRKRSSEEREDDALVVQGGKRVKA